MMIFNRLWPVVMLIIACKREIFPSKTPPTEVVIKDTRLAELSGLAASVANPDILYVHNDSGDSSRIFAISTDGKLQRICYFKGDPKLKPLGVKDCEDMAVSIGPAEGASYMYLGDIGDNDAVRKTITVYRLREPSLASGLMGSSMQLDADPLFLRYPDGHHDAETLMADPVDKLLYIVTKREDSVAIYTTPLLFKANDTLTLTFRDRLHFTGVGQTRWITGGSISQNGQQVLLRSYTKVYYWRRKGGEALWQTMSRAATELPYQIEPQGEAIGFTIDGKGYFTVSEGKGPTLYYYEAPR